MQELHHVATCRTSCTSGTIASIQVRQEANQPGRCQGWGEAGRVASEPRSQGRAVERIDLHVGESGLVESASGAGAPRNRFGDVHDLIVRQGHRAETDLPEDEDVLTRHVAERGCSVDDDLGFVARHSRQRPSCPVLQRAGSNLTRRGSRSGACTSPRDDTPFIGDQTPQPTIYPAAAVHQNLRAESLYPGPTGSQASDASSSPPAAEVAPPVLENATSRRSVDHVVEIALLWDVDHDRDGVATGNVEHVDAQLSRPEDRPALSSAGLAGDEREALARMPDSSRRLSVRPHSSPSLRRASPVEASWRRARGASTASSSSRHSTCRRLVQADQGSTSGAAATTLLRAITCVLDPSVASHEWYRTPSPEKLQSGPTGNVNGALNVSVLPGGGSTSAAWCGSTPPPGCGRHTCRGCWRASPMPDRKNGVGTGR